MNAMFRMLYCTRQIYGMGDISTYIIIRSTASYSATRETTTSVGLAHTRPITEAVIYKAHYTRIIMEEDLCRGGGGGGGGLYTSLLCSIISPLFPNFLPFWYPCIFNGFCYLYIIYKFINRDFSVGELAEPISSQVSRWRLGITLHLHCSSTAWLHLTFAVQVPP